MTWATDRTRKAGGAWRCIVKRRASWLAYYDRRADDPDVVRRMTFRATENMRKRRQKALARMAKRHAMEAD
jgi:hypothetical protein